LDAGLDPAQTLFMEFTVVIAGGGFSGTMLAAQLLRRNPALSLAVVDKGSVPGRGVAYSTNYNCHLLNVPAGNMSALPEEPDHFLRWARANYEPSTQSTSFVPRRVYGRYVTSLLEETAAGSDGGTFRWIEGEVTAVEREPDQLKIELKDGSTLLTQSLVLAPGNFPPGDLRIPGLSKNSQRYMPSAWSANALRDIPADGSALLIGSGLTSVDVAIALKSEGFLGHIHILSRHGLIPQSHLLPHSQTGRWNWPQYWTGQRDVPRTTRQLLRLVRDQVKAASEVGCDWRPVIDALRPVTQEIWRSLPMHERKRFLRHVRAYWEVHRHRIAPEIGDEISDLLRKGRATVHAGRWTSYQEFSDRAEVSLRDRKTGSERHLSVDRVINCTGPATDFRRIGDPLIQNLLAQGIARPDSLFIGLDVDSNGAVIHSGGTPSCDVYAIGPIRKGFLWETIAVPELREQASELAEHLTTQIEASGRQHLRLPLESLRRQDTARK
jgi:uncharacterized NAD(P)/FAD-binding protein YdhS